MWREGATSVDFVVVAAKSDHFDEDGDDIFMIN